MVGVGLAQPLSLTRFRRNQYLPRVRGPPNAPLAFTFSSGEFGVSESLNQQIDRLQEIYKSELDPQGRAFVPLADAHRRLGDLGKALALIQEGLDVHPDFASAHMVAGWVHRSRQEPHDAMRSFERVLELDAENALARAAVAELIDDQRAQNYRDKMAAKGADEGAGGVAVEDERSVVPVASLAPGAPDEIATVPVGEQLLASDEHVRAVVPIASLAPGAPVEISAEPDSVAEGDPRRVVSIASLAPELPGEPTLASDTGLDSLSGGGDRSVVSIEALAPDPTRDGSDDVTPAGGEIYTETLAELYAGQGATDKAIEVYRKLIANDPGNDALNGRLTELETLEPDSGGALRERRTVPIAALAPDGNG